MLVKLRTALLCFLCLTTLFPLAVVLWFSTDVFNPTESGPLLAITAAYLIILVAGWTLIGRIADPLEAFSDTLLNQRKKGKLREIRPDLVKIQILEFDRVLNAYNDLASDVRRSHEQLSDNAMKDSVTGIGNRKYFESAATSQLLQRIGRSSRGILFFIDLDHFKAMNDTHGHAVGDAVLCQIAEKLYPSTKKLLDKKFRGVTATHPVVARIGGDEFAILLPISDSLEDIEGFCKDLHRSFPATVEVDGLKIRCQYSVGAAVYPKDGVDVPTLMRRADEALYQVKRAGRGKSALYGADSLLGDGSDIRAALTQAMSAGELCLEYQPKYCLHSMSVTGVEALIRWNHPVHGKIPPGMFLPAVEKTSQVSEIGDWVVKQALHDAAQFRKKGYDLSMAINVDAGHFNQRDFVNNIIEQCSLHKVATKMLQIEITEDVMDRSEGDFEKHAAMLRSAGIQLAIDDFGCGYSNLSRMASVEVDVVKLDRTMIWDAAHDPRCMSVMVAAINMAHALECSVVVEGVENERHVNLAKQAGADILQGYYLTRSLSIDDLLAWLEERNSSPIAKTHQKIESRLRVI